MYGNFMVKELKNDKETKRITTILRKNRMNYFIKDEGKLIKVLVGSTRRTTKRYEVCKSLGFKMEWGA